MWETVIGASTVQADGTRLVTVTGWDAAGADVGVSYIIPAAEADDPAMFAYVLNGILRRMERRGVV